MQMPRRVPLKYRDTEEGGEAWVVSREFAAKGKFCERCYFAIAQEDNVYIVYRVEYDLRKEDDLRASLQCTLENPLDAIKQLRNFETTAREAKDLVPVPDSLPTYIKFANRHGWHFNEAGHVIRIWAEKPIDSATFMSRESLNMLFNPESAKIPDLDTWDGLYRRIVNVLPPKAAPASDLCQDNAYPQFAQEAQEMLRRLGALAEGLQSKAYSQGQKEAALNNIADIVIVDPLKFSTSARMRTAQYLCDTAILVTLIKTGSEIYAAQFNEETQLEQSDLMLKLVKRIGQVAVGIAETRLEVPADDARKIADLIGAGPDACNRGLPLETILQTNPAVKPPKPSV